MGRFIKLAVAAVVMLVTAPSFAAAYAASDDAVITVVWTSDTSVAVVSTKNISNVVLEDCFGVHYTHEDFDGLVGTFEHPSGEAIMTVWVKSGNNKSDDGPGYGEKFVNPNIAVCSEETSTTTPPITIPTNPPTTVTTAVPFVPAPTPQPFVEVPRAGPPAPAPAPTDALKQLPHTGMNASLALLGALLGLAGLVIRRKFTA